MQQALHRLTAVNDAAADTTDDEGDAQSNRLGEVVVLSTAHSWNPQKLLRRSGAGDARADTVDAKALQLSRQPSQQHPLRTQPSQQLSSQSAAVPRTAAGRTAGELQTVTLVVLACVSWIVASSGAILVNKHIMVDLNFPYPGTVGAIGMVGTSIITFTAVRVLRLVPTTQRVSTKFFAAQILPTGLFLALSMQLGNTAYLHLSVAFVQMLKAFTPVCTMLFAFMFKLERPSIRLIAAVGLITAGVTAASYGEGNFSWVGLVAMLLSMVCEGLRLVLMQSLVAKRSFHPIEALYYLAPAASFWMLLFVGSTEAIHIHQDQHLAHIAGHPLYILASAVAGFGVNAMAMAVITLASALTLKVLGICKDVGLVLVGVAVLGEHVTNTQMLGYSISLVGLVWYNAIKTFGTSAVTAVTGQVHRGPVRVPVSSCAGSASAGGKRSGGGMRPNTHPVSMPSPFAKAATKLASQ